MSLLLRQLTFLCEPVGFIWFLIVLATVLLLRRRQWRMAGLVGGIALLMWFLGGSGFAGWLLGTEERRYTHNPKLADLPAADVVVMLGGGVQPSKYDAFGLEMMPSGDRAIMALELMRLGKGKTLVLGGSDQKARDGTPRVEPDMMKQWFESWKLFPQPILSLGHTDNTREEAVHLAKLAKERGWQSVILVTSAWHMRRTEAVYRTQGFNPVCVPCDFQTSVSIETSSTWTVIPRYHGYVKLALYMREKIAWATYRARGWISREAANGGRPPQEP